MRAVSLLAVVFIHATSWVAGPDLPVQRGPYAAAMALARFCVPVLLLASGFAVHHAYGRPADARAFLRRRALRTMVPWLAWVPVYMVVALMYGKLEANPHDLLVWVVYGPGHLYFLVLVAQLAVLLPFLPESRRRLALVVAAAFALQVGLGAARTYAPLPSGPLEWPVTHLPQIEAPFWVGWFLLGCLASACYDRLRALSWLWPAALVLAVLGGVAVLAEAAMVPADGPRQGTAAFLWPSRVPATVGVAALLLWGGRELTPRLEWLWPAVQALSRRSLGVYVIHVGAIEVLAHSAILGLPGPLRLLALLLGSLALSYWLSGLLARTGAGALALGEPPPQPVRQREFGAG